MKVLRFFCWLFFPYILIFFRWRRLKTISRVLFILWSLILLSQIINSSHQQESQPASAAATTQEQPTNKPVQDKTNNKPAATTSIPVPKQPSQDQSKEQKIAQLRAQYNSKNATYQDKMNALKKLITIDKSYFLAKNPTIQDMGFAGDLFVTTSKNAVTQLNTVSNQLITQQANGVYWVVQVTLSDMGANPIPIDSDMFNLTTSDGRKFSTDTKAELIYPKSILTDTLNPSVDDTGYLIFDMPTDLKLSDVMLNVQNGFNNVKLKLS